MLKNNFKLLDKNKVTLVMSMVYMLISVFTILVVGYFSYSASRMYITRHFKTETVRIIDKISANIDEKMKYYNFMANTLLVDSDIINYINQKSSMDKLFYSKAADKLYNLISKKSEIQDIRIYTNNKFIYNDNHFFYDEKSVSGEEWYINSPREREVFIAQVKDNNVDVVVSFIRNIASPDYSAYIEKIGLLSMHIKAEAIFSDIEGFFLDKIDYLFVLNKEGTVVYSNQSHFIGNKVPEQILSNSLYEEQRQYQSFNYSDRNNIYICRNINSDKWKLVCVSSISKLLIGSNYIRYITVAAVILSMVIFLILTVWFSQKIHLRLVKLNERIARIGEGQFDLCAAESGNDEIGILSKKVSITANKLALLIEENKRQLLEKQKIHLKFLRSQINPYLLHNTLSNINWLAIRENMKDLSEMAVSLSEFYRLTLNIENNTIIFMEEIKLTRAYIRLQEMAYPGLISFVIDMDEGLKRFITAKLIIQPIIENAIIHGILPKGGHGTVLIKGRFDGKNITLRIIDDGIGFNYEKSIAPQVNGLGIKSTDERIKLLFGPQYGIEIFSRIGIGTCVTISLPALVREI